MAPLISYLFHLHNTPRNDFFPFFCCHCFNLGLCCFFFFPESLQHFSTAFLLYTVVLCKTPLILHYLITFSCFSVFLLKFKLFNCVQNFPGSAPPATIPPRSPFPLLPLPSTREPCPSLGQASFSDRAHASLFLMLLPG